MATILIAAAGAACDRTLSARAATVVDSVIPRDEALRRFRIGLPEVDSLSGGERSRDALVQAFVRALAANDTAALRAMLMTKAEYAWLYYPTNPQGLPPYDLAPALYWFMIDGRSAQGLTQALAERGGRPLHIVGYTCDPAASHEGDNRVYGPCQLRRVQAPGDTVAERLFGPILERGGRFKFVSYANKL
jgi:hypothetical protein